jgi:hypothetical protein
VIAHDAATGCDHPLAIVQFVRTHHIGRRTIVEGRCRCGYAVTVDPAQDIGEHGSNRSEGHAVEGVTASGGHHVRNARNSAIFGRGSE